MFDSIKTLAVAAVLGLCITVTGALASGDHAKKCGKTDAGHACAGSGSSKECAGSSSSKECAGSGSSRACASTSRACPAPAASMPACCAKHAAGQTQECCTKHQAGQPQACCSGQAAAPAAMEAGCCKAGAERGQLSPSMQNLMGKVDELRRRRAQ